MNKLSKILLFIIIILIIALGIMTFSYFKMKTAAQDNLNLYLEANKKIMQLNEEYAESQNADIEAVENEVNK